MLALLKKDKPEKDLKRIMIEQLDVFLAEETTPFVEHLFEAINTEEYLKGATAATVASIAMAKADTTYSNSAASSNAAPVATAAAAAAAAATTMAANTATTAVNTKQPSSNSSEVIIIEDNTYKASGSCASSAIKGKGSDLVMASNEAVRVNSNMTGAIVAPSAFGSAAGNSEGRLFTKTSGNSEEVCSKTSPFIGMYLTNSSGSIY